MAKTRTAPAERDTETRETEARVTHYTPPANLPNPTRKTDMLSVGYEPICWVRPTTGMSPCGIVKVGSLV